MVAVAVLAMLYQILKLSVDASLGASMYVAQAVGALIALVIVALLYAFLAIPAIVRGGNCICLDLDRCDRQLSWDRWRPMSWRQLLPFEWQKPRLLPCFLQ